MVTSENFGVRGRKPPITANTLFTREMYERCPIDPILVAWQLRGLRVVLAGRQGRLPVHVCGDLFGWHHHRRGMRALVKEYRRSSRGCAYFVRAHPDCPLAKLRLRQAVVLPLAACAAARRAAAAAADGYGTAAGRFMLRLRGGARRHQVVRSRRLESLAYPLVGLTLGVVFTTGLVTNLIRPGPGCRGRPGAASPAAAAEAGSAASRQEALAVRSTAICAVQAACRSPWSGATQPTETRPTTCGSAAWSWRTGCTEHRGHPRTRTGPAHRFYPPIGALADSIGGLAGASILSLLHARGHGLALPHGLRLIGRTGALFAAALWAFSEPVLRLAFATSDPLSILLTALSAFLIVQAGSVGAVAS